MVVIVACSSVAPFQFTLEQDSYVTDSQQTSRFYPRGTVIQAQPNSYTLIESPGHLSVMLPPSTDLPNQVKVSLKPLDGWGEEVVGKQVDRRVAEVFFQLNEIQSLLAREDATEALARVRFLEQRYPQLVSLKYLKITALLAVNRRDEAKQVLATFRKEFSESEAGNKLLELMIKEKSQRVPASVCPRWEAQSNLPGDRK
jgi:predicted Zn-dependent protease